MGKDVVGGVFMSVRQGAITKIHSGRDECFDV